MRERRELKRERRETESLEDGNIELPLPSSNGAIEHPGAIQSVDLPIGSEASASDLQCAPCNAAPGEDTVSEASAGGNAAATATSAAADVETVNEGGGTASPEVTPAALRLAQQSPMVPPLLRPAKSNPLLPPPRGALVVF